MAASAAPLSSTRWSRTLAHTLLACSASLALHAVALGGLAWLYHRSIAMTLPAPEVRLAAVYLAPAAVREEGRPEAAPAAPVAQETREAAPPPAPVAVEPRSEAPSPRAAPAPPQQIVKAAAAEAPERTQSDLSRASEPPSAAADGRVHQPAREGAQPATSLASQPVVSAGPSVPLSVPAGRGTQGGGRATDARTHAGIEWRVQDWLAQHRHYPRAARRSGAEGTVWVRFVLDRAGALQGSEILESSGHAVLDRAALELLERASPFPALPPELTTDEIELVLPIEYDLTRTGRG
jgi:protein TonB